jgi:hypothetical protein
MTKPDIIEKLIETVYDGAKLIIEEDPQGEYEITPMAFLLAGTELKLIPMPWENEREKQVYLSFLRTVCQDSFITGYAIVSEAWTVTVAKDASKLTVMPSEHPDRVEVVNIVAQARGKPSVLMTARITRQEGGRRIVGPYEIDSSEVRGRLANLFDPPERLH